MGVSKRPPPMAVLSSKGILVDLDDQGRVLVRMEVNGAAEVARDMTLALAGRHGPGESLLSLLCQQIITVGRTARSRQQSR